MGEFRVEVTRDGHVESIHRVAAVVLDRTGRVVAEAGDPDLVTFWRSAAKPFQAIPLVEDGAADHFGFGPEELALTCASHSSEPVHLAVVDRMLARIGCTETDLACGPHPPLGAAVAREVVDRGTTLTPRWSNCSGKHAGMLTLARQHGWPIAGYQAAGHPVQDRLLAAVCQWTDIRPDRIWQAVDGCTTVSFGLPLRNMALAYARFGQATDGAARVIRDAMLADPVLIAGEGRLCTDLMCASPGRIVAKVGAEGIYCATIPAAGLGIALKVEDGDMRSCGVALMGLLRQLDRHLEVPLLPETGLEAHERIPIHNTRGAAIGELRSAGMLRFSGQP